MNGTTAAVLAVGAPPLVEEFAITVAAAAVFGYLAQRIGLVSIAGFLAAGVLIGPNALGWIDDLVLVEQMGEIGVIFLMFFIGLELSGEMSKKMGSLLFGGGALTSGTDDRRRGPERTRRRRLRSGDRFRADHRPRRVTPALPGATPQREDQRC